jgi:hypothetical protein
MPKDSKIPPKEKEEAVASKSAKLPNVNVTAPHIPRNVNYYSHFLVHPYITEKDVEWVLKLRNTESDAVTYPLNKTRRNCMTDFHVFRMYHLQWLIARPPLASRSIM